MNWIGQTAWHILTYVSSLFLFAGLRLKLFSYTVEGWIWPFSMLAEPLRTLGNALDEVEDNILKFRNDFESYRAFLNDLWEGSGLNTLINRVFWEWNTFKRDPKSYISSKMNEMIREWPLLLDAPWYWILHRLYEYDYTVHNWVAYPVAAFKSWLSGAYPDFYDLMINGWRGLVNLVDMVSHEAYLFLQDPVEYIKALFVDVLGWSMYFWYDAPGYLFGMLMSYLDLHIVNWSGMLAKSGERILRYLWENVI